MQPLYYMAQKSFIATEPAMEMSVFSLDRSDMYDRLTAPYYSIVNPILLQNHIREKVEKKGNPSIR